MIYACSKLPALARIERASSRADLVIYLKEIGLGQIGDDLDLDLDLDLIISHGQVNRVRGNWEALRG